MTNKNNYTNENVSLLLYVSSGCGFGIFIGSIVSLLTAMLMSRWIDNNVPWENQDIGDGIAIIAVVIFVFISCVIISALGGLMAGLILKKNTRS